MSTNTNNTLIERLFAAGAHFGFSKSRRHPTVKPFIFGNKQGTDIIDLESSAAQLDVAKAVVQQVASEGKKILFVGTKDEVIRIVERAAHAAGTPFVVNRWIGGMLTNFTEIKKRLERLAALVAEGESGELERKYTKKERVVIGREADKLVHNFGGIQTLDRVPNLLVVVDPRHDHIAVEEARELNIPTIGIMSSDNDVSLVTYPIVVNDTLSTSVSLVLEELTNALKDGVAAYVPKPVRDGADRPRRSFERRPARR